MRVRRVAFEDREEVQQVVVSTPSDKSSSSHISGGRGRTKRHTVEDIWSNGVQSTESGRPLLNRSKSGAFQGQIVRNSTGNQIFSKLTQLLVISDLGQDNDDEMALMLMSELVRSEEVVPLGVVANLRPAASRAALARGTLDMLGLHHVPVGIGTDGGSKKHTDTFSAFISEGMTGVDYLKEPMEAVKRVLEAEGTPREAATCKECRIYSGQKLLRSVLQQATPVSVTLLLLSSMRDAAEFLRNDEQLFVQKVKCVTIMGGVEEIAEDRPLKPDMAAHNNCFDTESAGFLYQRLWELGVPMVVLSRFAAYSCPVGRHVYDLMVRSPVPNPVACRLHRAQRASIENLWADVNAGGRLPERCDSRWFCDTFCDGEGYDPEACFSNVLV